jgi:predicted nucleotidyltransferase
MSLAGALFTDAQSRIFRWVFGFPNRSFHLSELRRLTGLGSAWLVSSQRVGNQRRFQANAKSPIYDELIAVTRKTLGVQPMLREALKTLASEIKAAWIYGSVAKQSETAQSDVDVMFVAENLPVNKVLEVLVQLEKELGRKINPTCFTPAEFELRLGDPDSFVNRVLAQRVLPLIGDAPVAAAAR